MNRELEQWLRALPLNRMVDIDGEAVYLKVGSDGAELGLYLARAESECDIAEPSRAGFQSALEFEAGLGLEAKDNMLTLTQWLPRVASWFEAADALERILNQASMWRARMGPPRPYRDVHANRREEHIRRLLSGVNDGPA